MRTAPSPQPTPPNYELVRSGRARRGRLPAPPNPTPSPAEKPGGNARRKAVCRRPDPDNFAYLKKTDPKVKPHR